MLCSDGGATSGAKMTPLFQDEQRDQLIIDLMATGFPIEMVYKVILDDYVARIEVGTDESVAFLTTGATERENIITLCSVGSDVASNVCKESN